MLKTQILTERLSDCMASADVAFRVRTARLLGFASNRRAEMSRLIALKFVACALLAGVMWQGASAADVDACSRFKWDVSRELAVMKQTPQAITVAIRPGADVSQLSVGTL
jgi:hypothetical protein